MRNGFVVIDSDRHLMEPANLWADRMEKQYRHRAPFLIDDFTGTAIVDGITNNNGTKWNGKTRDELTQARRSGGTTPGFARDIHWRFRYYDAIRNDFSAASYLRDMDKTGVDAAVCFGTAQLYFNWRDNIEIGFVADACRAYNDWLHEYCSIDPRRLFAIAALPMQDVKLAVKEAQRAVRDLGLIGFYLRPNPLLGRQWHHPDYDYFFSAVEELGRPICFHEGGSTNMPQARLPFGKTFYARHAMSHPFENMLACFSMCAMGVFERHPRLRAFFAECTSGWIPFLVDWMDELVDNPAFNRDVKLQERPSAYYKRQGIVSCESGEETLASTEALIGQDNMLWASDYPHPDEVMKFPDTLMPMVTDRHVSKEFIRKILWDNPNRFFGLELQESAFVVKEAAE
jgi:uncharacterized protein